jgi:hypothetical protein
MQTRELYEKKAQAQVHEWSARIDLFKAQSEKLAAQAKLDFKAHIDGMHAKVNAARSRLEAMAGATDDRWDGVVEELEQTWATLKASAERVRDALKPHKT